MDRRQLPIGIQDFRVLREERHYYVDKTAFIRQLVEGGATISCRGRGASARAC